MGGNLPWHFANVYLAALLATGSSFLTTLHSCSISSRGPSLDLRNSSAPPLSCRLEDWHYELCKLNYLSLF